MEDIQEQDTVLKIGGSIPSKGVKWDHDDSAWVIGKIAVFEIAFPEDKSGNVIRVHKSRLSEAYVMDQDEAEKLVDRLRLEETGQATIFTQLIDKDEEEV